MTRRQRKRDALIRRILVGAPIEAEKPLLRRCLEFVVTTTPSLLLLGLQYLSDLAEFSELGFG